MPATMGSGPMKDNYVSGLEKKVASKVGDVMGAGRKLAGYITGPVGQMFDGGKPSKPKLTPDQMKRQFMQDYGRSMKARRARPIDRPMSRGKFGL